MRKDEAEFVIYIINEIANTSGKSTSQVYKTLVKSGCLQDYLVPLYDVLHTMSSASVVNDVFEYLAVRGEKL